MMPTSFDRPPSARFLLAVAIAVAISGCTGQSGEDTNAAGNLGGPVTDLPVVPRPQPPLDRAALLSAVAQAASASAAGSPDPVAQRRLDGRQFELRIRFGCRGPAPELDKRWLGWSFDTSSRRLRVMAKPTISTDDPLVAALGAEEFEAVEGFWIPRPWLLQAVCPAGAAVQSQAPAQPDAPADPGGEAAAAAAGADAVEPQDPVPRGARIGIAHFFRATDPRTSRRDGRPYEAISIVPEDRPLRSQGFTLVLSGRLQAFPGIGVIGCVSKGSDSPPECVISAQLDRVWIENPESGERIAEWGRG